MVAGTGSTSFGPILKTIFPRSRYIELVEQMDPFLGLVNKPDDFEGDYIKIPTQYLLTQSVGSTIANAETNAQDSEFKAFLLTRQKYYASNQFERELAEAARGDKGSFIRGMEKVIRDGAQTLTRELVRQVYGSYTGVRGVAGTISSADILLSDPYTGIWFEKGQILQMAATGTPTTPRTGTVTVLSVTKNGTDSTITCTGNVTAGISAAVDTDVIFRNGDSTKCLHGMDDWNPATAPGATTFFGVDRTADLNNLSGLRLTSSATNLEDAVLDALAEFGWLGATKIDYVIIHTARFMELAKEASSRVTRDDSVKSKEAGFGYQALSMAGPNGVVKILPSWAINYNTVRMITSDTWSLHTLGSAPGLIKDPMDGKYVHRVSGYDRFKVEQGWFANLACESLKDNGILTLS